MLHGAGDFLRELDRCLPEIPRSVTLAVLVIDAILLIALLVVKKLCAERLQLYRWHKTILEMYKYVNQVYFCGFSLADLAANHFFARFATFNSQNGGPGVCHLAAALDMIALKGVKSARLVFGVDQREYTHSWVEFRHRGRWWVMDPVWTHCFVAQRQEFYRQAQTKPLYVCKYREFWSFPISEELSDLLRKPKTSYLAYELIMAYSHYDQRDAQFHPRIRELRLAELQIDDKVGTYTNPCTYFRLPGLVLTGRVVREYMARPGRERPKARTIRRIRSIQRTLKGRFEKYELEHGTTE